jgi:hypothetical protein
MRRLHSIPVTEGVIFILILLYRVFIIFRRSRDWASWASRWGRSRAGTSTKREAS